MSSSNLIAVFRTFPKDIYRVNNGPYVKLRVWRPSLKIYDIFTDDHGRVKPKALDPSTYKAPNGASMRPNSQYQQSLVAARYRGDNTIVYAIPEGSELPEDLILVHERGDHYALQPAKGMYIDELDTKINHFLKAKARVYTRKQWLQAYPKATDSYVHQTQKGRSSYPRPRH